MKGAIKAGAAARVAVFLCLAGLATPSQRPQLPKGAQLGHREPGAPSLDGYLVKGRVCLPVKRFAFESGYEMNVSPSGRHVAIVVNKQMSLLFDGRVAQIAGRDLPLSVPPVARNNDFYVPLEFFEKAYPVRFTYDARARRMTAQLPGRTLKMTIRPLPEK